MPICLQRSESLYSVYRCFDHARTCVKEHIVTFQAACQVLLKLQQQPVAGARYLIHGPAVIKSDKSEYWYKVHNTPDGTQIECNQMYTVLLHEKSAGPVINVMRRSGNVISLAWRNIATHREAYAIASWLETNNSHENVHYYVELPCRSQREPALAKRHGHRARPSHQELKISEHQHPSEYMVVCIRAGVQKPLICESFHSRDDAVRHARKMQTLTSNPNTRYVVTFENRILPEYTLQQPKKNSRPRSKHGGPYKVILVRGTESLLIKDGFWTEAAACEYALQLQEQSTVSSVRYVVEIAHKQIKPTKPHKPSTPIPFDPYFDRRDELLGLGIPAQTGHGRRSRKGFNDL